MINCPGFIINWTRFKGLFGLTVNIYHSKISHMEPLQFFLIKNNVKTNDINILKDLTNLKNLYSRQLAKMPREYIVKLLFDTVHESLIVKMGQKIVAGVTFRGFKDRPFY